MSAGRCDEPGRTLRTVDEALEVTAWQLAAGDLPSEQLTDIACAALERGVDSRPSENSAGSRVVTCVKPQTSSKRPSTSSASSSPTKTRHCGTSFAGRLDAS